MEYRLESYNKKKVLFENIPLKCCFDTSTKQQYLKDFKGIERVNLHYYIRFIEKIKSGSYNSVFKINHNDDPSKFLVIKLPKTDRYHRPYDSFYDDDYDNICASTACVASRYSLIFSEIVKKNIFPNFVQVIDIYFCNNRYPINIQELANSDLADYFCSANIDGSENLIVQSLLSFYFMNTKLFISHYDAKPANILVKLLVKPEVIEYKLNDDNIIKLQTDKLALITDFDFTRGTFMSYEMMNVFESYIDKYKYKSEYYDCVLGFSRKYNSAKHILDIIEFLGITLLSCKLSSVIKVKIFNFLHDYTIKNLDFFECIKKYYSNVLSESLPTITYDINKQIDDIDISFTKYKKLICRIMTHSDYHGNYGDKYIQNMFNTNLFIRNIEDYLTSKKEFENENEYKLCMNYSKYLSDGNVKLDKIFQFIIRLKIYHKISTYEILTAMYMLHYYINKTRDEECNYTELCIVCLYLSNFRKYDLTFFRLNVLKSSKRDLYKLLKRVLIMFNT